MASRSGVDAGAVSFALLLLSPPALKVAHRRPDGV
jgi:hypothetical protein